MDATPARGPKRSLLRKNLSLCTWDGIAAMPLSIMSQPGNAVVAAMLTGTFALSTRSYGFITSLPFWFNFLQVLLTPLLAQKLSARALSIASVWLHAAGWTALAIALPFIPHGDPGRGIFIAIFSVIALATAIQGVSWNGWMQAVVPHRLRGKYFGRRNRLLYVSMLAFLFTVSVVLGWLDDSLPAFQVLFGVAIMLRCLSAFAEMNMQTNSSAKPAVAEPHWREQVRTVRADPQLTRFILFAAVMGFAINLFSPFYPLFMFNELHLSASKANLILLVGPLTAAIAFPAWGRLLDRYGNIPVMIVSLFAWQISYFLWSFIHPGDTWLLVIVLAAGGFLSPGYGIGVFGLLLKLTPPNARTMGMALFASISSLATAFGPIVGSNLLAWAQAQGFPSLLVFHVAFAITPVLTMIVCLLLRHVNEEKASNVTDVVDGMRNVRTLASLFGLNFLVNQIFYRDGSAPAKRRK